MERITLTRQQRRTVINRVIVAQRMMAAYERQLIQKRDAEIRRVVFAAVAMGVGVQAAQIAYEMTRESYLTDILTSLYVAVGVQTATDVIQHYREQSQKASDTEYLEFIVQRFIREHVGKKVKIIEGTFKEELRQMLIDTFEDGLTEGVEANVNKIYDDIVQRWNKMKKWQVRRIVQTETMEAMAVGQYEAMNRLGVQYKKVWTATFINTRPQHALMDGVAVGKDEFFVMPNGDKMLYPHDSLHGASAGNLINCACGTYDIPV